MINSEQLYKYLTEDHNVSDGQKKLIWNAANYAAGLPSAEEQAAFLSTMTKGIYSRNDQPEITAESIACIQKKKTLVRVWKTTTRVTTQVQVRCYDLEVNEDATEKEIIERAKDIPKWNQVSIKTTGKTEKDIYRIENSEELIRKEREEMANTLVLVKDGNTGKTKSKPFGDLKSGDIVICKTDCNEYIVTRPPSPTKNKKGELRISARNERFKRCRRQLSPKDLAWSEEPEADY